MFHSPHIALNKIDSFLLLLMRHVALSMNAISDIHTCMDNPLYRHAYNIMSNPSCIHVLPHRGGDAVLRVLSQLWCVLEGLSSRAEEVEGSKLTKAPPLLEEELALATFRATSS